MIKGLGTVIYQVADLDRAKAWYTKAFQQAPYFDEPFYVGFNVAGYELGLHPNETAGQHGAGDGVDERGEVGLLTRNIRIEEDLIDQLFNSSEKRLARTLLLLAWPNRLYVATFRPAIGLLNAMANAGVRLLGAPAET